MPKIVLENVTKRWGDFYGADHLNMVIEDQAFITLLGPSGCGKTTTLRMIAGLETPTSGKITIGDQVVFDSETGINVPANERHVGFLFQNYALWPHMTVYKNILFGLQNVKQVMPLHASEAERLSKLSKLVLEYDKIKKADENATDSNGKRDEKKFLICLIDELSISMYSAKEIAALGLEKMDRDEAMKKAKEASDEFAKRFLDESQKIESKGQSVDPKTFDIKDASGKVILKNRRLDKEEMDLKLRHAAKVVKIGEFMDRYPSELSGGQQQRVAIARTLAPGPKVLFMDEPLSNLDAKLRLEMRAELKRLHVETGSTFVYVTHDQLEAMTLATKICLISNGVIQQYDPPLTVYGTPKNLFVADFVGNPAINFIEVKAKEENGIISLDAFDSSIKMKYHPADNLHLEEEVQERLRLQKENEERLAKYAAEKGYVEKKNKDLQFSFHISTVDGQLESKDEKALTDDEYVLGVRPEFLRIDDSGPIEAEVYAAMPSGMETTVRLKIGKYILTSVVFSRIDYPVGSKVHLNIDTDNILLFDRIDGRLVANGSVEID